MPDVRNALIFTPDNSFDIGASGATRPRDLFLGRNLIYGGTLMLPDGSALTPSLVFTNSQTTGLYRAGADSIGFATNGLARWAISATGHLVTPADNTYDIGASGATRPRDLYLGRNIFAGGTLFVADFSTSPNTSRMRFKTSTVNNGSFVGAIPDGTGIGTAFIAYEINDSANSPYVIMWSDGTNGILGTGASGTGSPRDLSIWANGEKWKILTTGHFHPAVNNTYDIGTSALAVRNLYVAGQVVASNIGTNTAADVIFITNGAVRWKVLNSGHFAPNADNVADLGTSSSRLRDLYVAGTLNAPDVPRLNQLTNGGFEVWQRGNGAFTGTAGGVITADRWYLQARGTSACTCSRDTTTVDGGVGASMSVVVTATSTTNTDTTNSATVMTMNMNESGGGAQLLGRPSTFSIRVFTTTASAVVTPYFYDNTGAVFTNGTPVTLSASTWTTISMTSTQSTASGSWFIGLFFHTVATYKLDNAMLVAGSAAATFVPQHPAEELARCQRYCEFLGTDQNFSSFGIGQVTTTTRSITTITYKATKPVTPTITYTAASTFQVTNTSGNGVTGSAVSNSIVGLNTVSVICDVASGLVAGSATQFMAANTLSAKILIETA